MSSCSSNADEDHSLSPTDSVRVTLVAPLNDPTVNSCATHDTNSNSKYHPPSPPSSPSSSPPVAAASNDVKIRRAPRRKPRVRCGKCDCCTRLDCGECFPCLQKKKFGGDGSCKEPCVHRKCQDLQERTPNVQKRKKTENQSSAEEEYQPCAADIIWISQQDQQHPSQDPHIQGQGTRDSDSTQNVIDKSDESSSSSSSESTVMDKNTSLTKRKSSLETSLSTVDSTGVPSKRRSMSETKRSSTSSNNSSINHNISTTTAKSKIVTEPKNANNKSTSTNKSKTLPESATRSNVKSMIAKKARSLPQAASTNKHTQNKTKTQSVQSNKTTITKSKPRSKRSRNSNASTNGTVPASSSLLSSNIPLATVVSNDYLLRKDRPYLYGKPTPRRVMGMCAGCNGKRTDELLSEPILLCDGCDREFHLDCCLPSLDDIPSGTYFCLDCSPTGGTASLEKYFDNHHEERANYESSFHFVEQTIKSRLQEMEPDDSNQLGSESPLSELARVSKLHHDAMSFSQRYMALKKDHVATPPTNNNSNTKTKNAMESIKPDFFVGKLIRLYCPNDNQYHSGRILDCRLAKHTTQFWGSEVSDVEYLVRFLAGKDYRKTEYYQWIILEEHALAISATLIWGMNVIRRGVLGWNPALTWLRTSLELLPIQQLLSRADNQLYTVNDEVKPEHKSWALASYYGDDQHELVDLKDEAVDFFSLAFGKARHQRNKSFPEADVRVEICMGLAQVEWEELKRVRAWRNMKLANFFHPKALMARDEAALDPCLQRDRDSRLCPSIQVDFDRTYLLRRLGRGSTRDMGASLVCELMAPSPQIMRELA